MKPGYKPDLASPTEIENFVRAFYAKVAHDDLLGPVFVNQAGVDWDEHIEKLTAFWCKLELNISGFNGAPTAKHTALSREVPFRAEQFERWFNLFCATIDSGWSGPHVENMKQTAMRIAEVQSRLVERSEPWTPPAP